MRNFRPLMLVNFIFLVAVLFLTKGCIDDIKPIGEPFDKLEAINGTWKLIEVIQIDEIDDDEASKRLDVSSILIGTDPAEFSIDSGSKSYTIETGTSRLVIASSGSWSFDDDEFPSEIILNNMEVLKMQSSIRPFDTELRVLYTRPKGDCLDVNFADLEGYISYEYVFERQ